MLSVNGLTKKYGKLLANDNISLNANSGEIALLVGPNGAGKSTAIKAIAGLLRYDGTITIDGYPNKSCEAKRQLGYIPEAPSVYDLLTIDEHMQFIARAYELKNGWQERAEELLSKFQLIDNRTKFGKELSKGMQQKVSICCALLPSPKLLLVDEPMVGLDPYAIKELKETFIQERSKGTALLISTHLLNSVEDIWDKAFILQKGKIQAECARKDVGAHNESLEELFFEITGGSEEIKA